MPVKIMKKQVSLPVQNTQVKHDSNGEKEINPLIRNCQSVDILENKNEKTIKMTKKYICATNTSYSFFINCAQ